MEYSQLANYSEDQKVEKQWDVIQTLDAMEDLPNLLVLSYDKEYRNIVDINREMKQIHWERFYPIRLSWRLWTLILIILIQIYVKQIAQLKIKTLELNCQTLK